MTVLTLHRNPRPVALLLALTLAGACTPDEGNSSRRRPIIGGVADTTHPQVMLVRHQNMDCSGTLVAPDLVLTAHHCVASALSSPACDADFQPGGSSSAALMFPVLSASALKIHRGVTPTGQSPLVVAAVLTQPDFQTRPICGNDAVLLRLASPVGDISPLTPRLYLPPLLGEPTTVVGYGLTDPQNVLSSGKRHRREGVTVSQVGRSKKSSGAWSTVDHEFRISEGPCGGDSGGPALDGSGALFGVMSRGSKSTCKEMIYQQLVDNASWLAAELVTSYERTGGKAPAALTRPVAGAAAPGEACWAADQCASGLVCRPLEGRYRCLEADCGHCPTGWSCRGDDTGTDVCAPPTMDLGAPADSGVDGAMPSDVGSDGGSDASTLDPADDAGCRLGGAGRPAGAFGAALLLLALLALRRRQR